jgi:hypothetical protein
MSCSGLGGGGMGVGGIPTAPGGSAVSDPNTRTGTDSNGNNDPGNQTPSGTSGQTNTTGTSSDNSGSFANNAMARSLGGAYSPYINQGSEGHPLGQPSITVVIGIVDGNGHPIYGPVNPGMTLTDDLSDGPYAGHYAGHCYDVAKNTLDPLKKLDPQNPDNLPTLKIQAGNDPNSTSGWKDTPIFPFDYYSTIKCNSGWCNTNTCGYSSYVVLSYLPDSIFDADGNCLYSTKVSGSYTLSNIHYYGETISSCAELKGEGNQVTVILKPQTPSNAIK